MLWSFGKELGKYKGEITCDFCHRVFEITLEPGFPENKIDNDTKVHFCPFCGSDNIVIEE